jgi:hypothetical protein
LNGSDSRDSNEDMTLLNAIQKYSNYEFKSVYEKCGYKVDGFDPTQNYHETFDQSNNIKKEGNK